MNTIEITEIDAELKVFLAEHLDTKTFNELLLVDELDHMHHCAKITILASISTIQVCDKVVHCINRFLANLPFEEARAYVDAKNKQDKCKQYCRYKCIDVGLLRCIRTNKERNDRFII